MLYIFPINQATIFRYEERSNVIEQKKELEKERLYLYERIVSHLLKTKELYNAHNLTIKNESQLFDIHEIANIISNQQHFGKCLNVIQPSEAALAPETTLFSVIVTPGDIKIKEI